MDCIYVRTINSYNYIQQNINVFQLDKHGAGKIVKNSIPRVY